MIDFDISFVIQLINFLIVLLVLNLLLFKPIRGIIKQRAEKMGAQMTDIEDFNEKAAQKLTNYEAQLQKARVQGAGLREEYKDEGQSTERELLEKAHGEAASRLASAREEIQGQARAALGELKKEVDSYAARATDKILGQA